MSYDEEQQRRSRVVVETPTARREVYQSQTVRTPEKTGYSTGVVAAVALTAMALTAIIFLFLMNRGDDATNTNVRVTTQPTPMTQAPIITTTTTGVQPTPVVIEQPPIVTTQPAPVVVSPPTSTTMPPVTSSAPTTSSTPAPPDDSEIRARVNTAIQKDPDLSATGIIAEFSDGKATLTGSVASPDLKNRATRLAMTIKGVRRVDNQITVTGGAAEPATTP